MKRRYGDRSNWSRITERRYAQRVIADRDFHGYATLIEMEKVSEPLVVTYGDKEVCIVDDGYSWLQQFPHGNNHVVTTVFDENGKVVQWYIDICLDIGKEDGVPWFDDLFLDIVILPTGEVIVLDEDELEEALVSGIINQELHNLAWREVNRLLAEIDKNEFRLISLVDVHKKMLEGYLGS